MYGKIKDFLTKEISDIREAGLYKEERIIQSPQDAAIEVPSGKVLNFCANNYLGLSSHPALIEEAHEALDKWGYGLSSVRFICGTQGVHKELEDKISKFMGFEDTILFGSCFDANGALFEPLLGPDDAIISDALNHASIIDGIRLCKAQRFRYKHADMADLEAQLIASKDARHRMIFTDGVFSMDGDTAKLKEIVALAEKYDAMVGVDDSHATGFVGPTGRGAAEHHGVLDKIDVVTSTLGKAMGGASGGYITGRKEIIELLRQRGRPYLFSNTLSPVIAHASIKAFDLVDSSKELITTLHRNKDYFRTLMTEAGFDIREGDTPIVPIMLYDAPLAQKFAAALLDEGVYVIGFFFPVVPRNEARIRVQLSAAHTREQLDDAIASFIKVGKDLGVIK